MSTATTTIHSDEASAVVDDEGASILAGSQTGRAFAGHTDQRYIEELEQATLELGRYCEVDNAGNVGAPKFVKNGGMQFLLGHVARWHGCSEADALELFVDEALVSFQLNRAKREMAVLGSVSLDLVPDGPWPQDQGHPTEPKVLFVKVDPSTPGTKPLYAKAQREYMAVWFVPNVIEVPVVDPATGEPRLDADGEVITRSVPADRDDKPLEPRGKAQRLYCDDRHLAGYMGVVDWFSDRASAKLALRELQQAVRTIARPPKTADEPDALRDELLDADRDFDERFAAWKRSTAQSENEAPVDPFA